MTTSYCYNLAKLFWERQFSESEQSRSLLLRLDQQPITDPTSQYIISPSCFLYPCFAPCTSKCMFIIISPPLSGWGPLTFFRSHYHPWLPINQTLYQELTQLCLCLCVTIADKMCKCYVQGISVSLTKLIGILNVRVFVTMLSVNNYRRNWSWWRDLEWAV